MAMVLVLLSLAVCAVGLLTLTQATMGVGLICLACFLGILARLAQAREYFDARMVQAQRDLPPIPRG